MTVGMTMQAELASFLVSTSTSTARESGKSSSPVTVVNVDSNVNVNVHDDHHHDEDLKKPAKSSVSWLDAQREWLSSAFGTGSGSLSGIGDHDVNRSNGSNNKTDKRKNHQHHPHVTKNHPPSIHKNNHANARRSGEATAAATEAEAAAATVAATSTTMERETPNNKKAVVAVSSISKSNNNKTDSSSSSNNDNTETSIPGFQQFTLAQSKMSSASPQQRQRPAEALHCLTQVLKIHSELEVVNTDNDNDELDRRNADGDGSGVILLENDAELFREEDEEEIMNDDDDDVEDDDLPFQHTLRQLHLLQARTRYQIGQLLCQLASVSSRSSSSSTMGMNPSLDMTQVLTLAKECHVAIPAFLLGGGGGSHKTHNRNRNRLTLGTLDQASAVSTNNDLSFHAMVELQTSYRILNYMLQENDDIRQPLENDNDDENEDDDACSHHGQVQRQFVATCHLLAQIHATRPNQESKALAKLEETQALLHVAIHDENVNTGTGRCPAIHDVGTSSTLPLSSPSASSCYQSELAHTYTETGNLYYKMGRYDCATQHYQTSLLLYLKIRPVGVEDCGDGGDHSISHNPNAQVRFLKRRLCRSKSNVYALCLRGYWTADRGTI
jgi:tetratricopeptide (TPR) repeat protein